MLEIIYWNLMYFLLVMFAVMIFGEILENRKRRKAIRKTMAIYEAYLGDKSIPAYEWLLKDFFVDTYGKK